MEEEHAGGSLWEEGAVVHAGASGVGGAEGEIAENAFFSGESEGAAGWCFGSSEDDAIGGDVDVWGGVGRVGGCGAGVALCWSVVGGVESWLGWKLPLASSMKGIRCARWWLASAA